jgi:excisionase family DNA binding protein
LNGIWHACSETLACRGGVVYHDAVANLKPVRREGLCVSERGSIRDYASGLRADRGPDDRWLSVYEAAAMTLQHPDTVRRWIAAGLLSGEDRGRLGYRIRESEVERFLRDAIKTEGRNPADKGLSSNLVNVMQAAAAPSERARAGAGWPFNHRERDGVVP